MSLPWMRALERDYPVVGSTGTSSSKKKKHTDVIYAVFQKCADLEPDVVWKELFMKLAKGDLPKGFSVRNKTLAYTDNNKTRTVRMDLEPEALRENLTDLFSAKQGLTRSQILKDPDPTVLPLEWQDVKKKSDKQIYILEYILQEGKSLGWDDGLLESAYSKVREWIENGSIRQNNVSMSDGVVKEVKDVELNREGISLRDVSCKKTKTSIQTVHISRLYKNLCRVAKTRGEEQTVEPSESESTTT